MINKVTSILIILISILIYLLSPYTNVFNSKIITGGKESHTEEMVRRQPRMTLKQLEKVDKEQSQITEIIMYKVQNILRNDNIPYYIYEDIKNSIEYQSGLKIFNFNNHIGQRKLLLNEIQFYTRYFKKSSDNIVIYIGSAGGSHTPVITKLFPDIKLILIDPNFHTINEDYLYIYSNFDKMDDQNIIYQIRKLENEWWLDRKLNGIKKLKKVKYLYDKDNIYNLLNLSKEYKEGKRNTNTKNIEEQYNKFLRKYNHIIDDIMERKEKIFIIQDYATVSLMKYLREAIDEYKKIKVNVNILFISDIRTTIIEYSAPEDIDIIWNNMQQEAFMNIINPDKSMLKFHPPYGDNPKILEKMMNDINSNKTTYGYNETYDFIINDIKELKKCCNIRDKLFNKSFTKYYYLKSEKIFLQPWAPVSSSEARLIINSGENETETYDIKEWSDKFFYYKYYRSYSYYGGFIDKLRELKLEYDGCQDCRIELIIMVEYIIHFLNNRKLCDDYNEISELLENENIKKEIIRINKLIINETRELKNPRCYNIHGFLKNKPKYVYFYKSLLKDDLEIEIYQVKIDKTNINYVKKYNVIEYNDDIIIRPNDKLPITDNFIMNLNLRIIKYLLLK